MNKKLLALALTILLLFACLTACNNNISPKDKESIDSQIKLIAENAHIWEPFDIYPGDHFKFAVTDLDNNSRLEVITTVCRGTGLYSESVYYEVDETFNVLTKREHKTDNFKEFLQADIISSKAECFINPDTNERFYRFGDHHKATAAYTCNYKMCLTFKDKTVTEEMLAYWSISAATTDEAGNYEVTQTIKTREGKTLTQDEFLAYDDVYFEGFENHAVTINWQDLRLDGETLATDLETQELQKLLFDSYESFLIN